MLAAIKRPGKTFKFATNAMNVLINLLISCSKSQQDSSQKNGKVGLSSVLFLNPINSCGLIRRTKQTKPSVLSEKNVWQDCVAEDFALWLNARLRKVLPDVGKWKSEFGSHVSICALTCETWKNCPGGSEMSSLILLRRIKIENANTIAGLTYGFPAITHFMGFSHALSRKLMKTTS